jgi:hypothetical protein
VRQVKGHRTHPITICAFWMLSLSDAMFWRVRSVQCVRSIFNCAKLLLRSNGADSKADTWQASVNRGKERPDAAGASGQYTEYPFVFVTALSFEGAYKYLLAGSRATLLDILTS